MPGLNARASADPGAWSYAVDVNLKGVFNGMRAVLPEMRAQGGGVIVNLGSGAARTPLEGWSHYCAAKAATEMLTRCAYLENRGRGIRVFSLSPGTVATGHTMTRAITSVGCMLRLLLVYTVASARSAGDPSLLRSLSGGQGPWSPVGGPNCSRGPWTGRISG